MWVSKEQAAQNRQHILTAATRLFLEHGIHAIGVDTITREAGLTHGSLYSQFGSKEAIAVEAISVAVARSKHLWQRAVERKPGRDAFRPRRSSSSLRRPQSVLANAGRQDSG